MARSRGGCPGFLNFLCITWVSCISGCFASPGTGQKTKPDLKPRLAECSIEAAGRTLKPLSIERPGRDEQVAGGSRLAIDGDTITARPQSGGEKLWTSTSPDRASLDWVAASGDVAYFVGYRQDPATGRAVPDSPARLRRLDLKTGKWLGDLQVQGDERAGPGKRHVLAVIIGEGLVLVLDCLAKENPDGRVDSPVAYELSCFPEGQSAVSWVKSFPSTATRPYTGGFLWAPRRPQYAASEVQRLAWLGDMVLVTAEALQPIRCLNPDTGTEAWRLEDLWEFQRGFIGPSVWGYHLTRFGLEDFNEDRDQESKARVEFDRTTSCAIVGGPVVIPTSARGEHPQRILVAVSKGPKEGYTGYLSDCLLYELDDRGKPMSMTTLPRMVAGNIWHVQEEGIVWRCQDDAFLKVIPTEEREIHLMGPGGPDLLTRIAWFRQLLPGRPDAKLSADRAGDPVAFSATHAFCLPAGGYVSHEDAATYRFPITAVELGTGMDRSFVLKIPFEGKLSKPETNVSESGPAGRRILKVMGPYGLAVTKLEIDGDSLAITVGTDNETFLLQFDLRQLDLTNTTASRPIPAEEPISREAANLADEDGQTPLMNAAGRRSSALLIRALLDAGADVKARSKTGWTALMAAALYGSADAVQLLAEAGSDLEARDENHDHKTVLLWAAMSDQEATKKLRCLLQRGADPKAISETGWNSVMIAANCGHVAALEFLIKAGIDLNHRAKDGKTALMAARYVNGSTIVEVLVRAGADVNARDENGMTPLMHAAGGIKAGGTIQALLRAGADPLLKDMQGRTAADIARTPEKGGATRYGQAEAVELIDQAMRKAGKH
jgi:ankyrin repeat protein